MVAYCNASNRRISNTDNKFEVGGLAHSAITMTLPDGHQHVKGDVAYTKDEEVGCLLGNHPEMLAALQQQLVSELRKHKHDWFAYSVKELKGYHGKHGPFEIDLTTDKPIRAKP